MLGIFLDTETNGLNPQKHVLLEIALKILNVERGEELDQLERIVCPTLEEWERSEPSSLDVNGFTYKELKKGLRHEQLREQLIELFTTWNLIRGASVFICQNPSFDRAFFSQIVNPDLQESLLWPYHWLDLASMFWIAGIQKGKHQQGEFPWVTGFSKDKIAAACRLPPEAKPHRAMNGVNHLILCYQTIVGFPAR